MHHVAWTIFRDTNYRMNNPQVPLYMNNLLAISKVQLILISNQFFFIDTMKYILRHTVCQPWVDAVSKI